MAEQNAQDINQMMSATADMVVSAPKKSKFLWIVLGCVVVGVGLGVVVYQQSTKAPTPTPKSSVKPVSTPQVNVVPSPQSPTVSLVEAELNSVSFPKAGEIRVYYEVGGWVPLGMILKDVAGTHEFNFTAGAPSDRMKILDTGYILSGPTIVKIDSFLGTDKTKLSLGWAKPATNKCGFNGYTAIDITPNVDFATAQAGAEPIVSVQCWGDYSPNPKDPSSKDFNDYTLIWSYKPSGSVASTLPSATPIASKSPSPSVKASAVASAVASATPTPTPTPIASPRVVMPDTSDGTPVTGVFEITVGTISVGLILLILGLFSLLAL